MRANQQRKRVLSGIQPTGVIHIGNYIGAISHWVRSQEQFDNYFCIVDLHAMTVRHDPKVLREKKRELAGILFAAGIDPNRSALFIQSQVPAHAELAWIMNCLASMGQLERMTQYKEKSARYKEQATVGLFTYPALMAADILLYQADHVPVGEDQKQHVELTRDLAQRFNHHFGATFKIPEPVIPPVGARIMGLDDPEKKMSKSESAWGHAVAVLDSPDDIVKKFKSAKTDSGSTIAFNPEQAGVFNLLTIFQAFTGKSQAEIEAHFAGKMYGHLKLEVAEAVVESLRPLQQRYREITSDPHELDNLLRQGRERALPAAEETMRLVRERLGLG